jgi:hypothetical protein
MAPVDIKQRYSLYVPKPLARINLGDWQRRDLQSAKFGYAGVSIQTDSNLFVDITKGTHIQAKGGFVAQTTDWLQTSKNAMYIATTDTATVGADGAIVMAAGAGHGPTFTLDHGDSMDTYPYNNLSLHYRVEEVQNGLYEFFRGRRQKTETKPSPWRMFFKRDDRLFNSSKTKFLMNPFTAYGSNPMGYDGAEEVETKPALKGGFERVANVSWWRLFGSDDTWDTPAPPPKPLPGAQPGPLPEIPIDLFAGLGDVRKDALKALEKKADIEASTGAETEDQLVYGFSAYFSRFDPYLLFDPARFDKDVDKKKITKLDAMVMKILARANNALTKMKRTVDVVYKIGSLIKDNSIAKLGTDTAAAVDGFNLAIKGFRGQYETLIENPYITHKQGTFYDQMQDEAASGVVKRTETNIGTKLTPWAKHSEAQAVVRSGTPGKDYGVFGDKCTLAEGDVLTVTVDGITFTTPALALGGSPATVGKGAVLKGGAATTGAWVIPANAFVQVVFDNGTPVQVALPAQTVPALATEQAKDVALVAAGQAAHFEADRAAQIAALQQAVCTACGAKGALASGAITLTSATVGASSTVVLQESAGGLLANLGLATTSALGSNGAPATAAKLAKDLKPEDILALLNAATPTPALPAGKKASDYVAYSVEGEQVVITAAKKGDGSEVTVGGNMATKLGFVGDAYGWSAHDKIQDLDDFRRGQDDFEKAMLEVNALPQDTANLMRPMVIVWKNVAGAVNKLQGAMKAAVKIAGLKLPTTKGAIGLIANSGISLGTPDKIVGAGGQGIVFVADGGTGKADHAKYAMLEDIINSIAGADLAGAIREYILGTPSATPAPGSSLGFRVFSDTTVDLTARNTANLLALGRADDTHGGTIGTGIARVGGSYGSEIAGQKKVVVRAREKDSGRVELLGSTLALGYSELDLAEAKFGLEDQPGSGPRGMSAELKAAHPKTSSVIVHSTDQACIVVGDFMVQLRSKTKTDHTLAQAQQDKLDADGRLAQFTKEQVDLTAEKLKNSLILPLPGNEAKHAAAQDRILEIDARMVIVKKAIKDETKAVARCARAVTAAQMTNDEGVIISMRDPADGNNSSANNWAWKEKPSIVLGKKGVTITTTTGKDNDATTARITVDDKGIAIHVGDKKAGLVIKKDSVEISNGTKKAVLSNSGKFHSDASQIDFAAAQKITLG